MLSSEHKSAFIKYWKVVGGLQIGPGYGGFSEPGADFQLELRNPQASTLTEKGKFVFV
jgi:hypothetical protein